MAEDDKAKADVSAEKAYEAASSAAAKPEGVAKKAAAAAKPASKRKAPPKKAPVKKAPAKKAAVKAVAPTPPEKIVPVEPEVQAVEPAKPEEKVEVAKVEIVETPAEPKAKTAAVQKTATRKIAAKRKPRTAKPVAPKPVAKAKAKPVSSKSSTKPKPVKILKSKEPKMDIKFAGGFQDFFADAQSKAQEAFEKSTAMFGDYSDFAKDNAEAVVESGKILAEGLQDMGTNLVAESRSAFETVSGELKDLAAAKSPTDFFKLQSDMVRKSFDTAVAYGSKNSEAMLKLASDVAAPISGRVSVAVEKVRQSAV